MESVLQKQKKIFSALKNEFDYTNQMQAPRVEAVVISTGTGKKNTDKHAMGIIEDRLLKITGQKAAPRGAKKSIAAFKVRQGDAIGYQVTLRGKRMYDFLEKLISIALPRARDFRGLSVDSIDEMGNYTIGIREHTIFPETSDEDLKDVFGFSVTIVTTAKTKKEAKALLINLGFPLQKEKQEI
ncbi:50S ribosomal protein L5 [Patescibacteria group bacterium]|nr:50S ribosomal protein L5 [Patescibacteria group bacterium]